jgi:hypothetical protein
LALAGRTTVAAWSVTPSAVLLQDAINQAACLKFVEALHSGPEHFMAQVLDVLLLESMLSNKVQDQVPLLVAAMPSGTVAVPV